MAPKYQDHLAASVLNEGIIVNYRMLSRALKIHVNVAKEMLYDFHRTQNARKPSSVHATYLLSGIRKPVTTSQTNGHHTPVTGDSFMSDGIISSSMPAQEVETEQIPVTTVTLVAEERLESVKASYTSITSIHVYSIEPGPITNIHILADCNRKVATEYASEDPLVDWKQYGTIQNPNAKRRTTRKPPPPAALAIPTTAGMKPAQKPAAAAQKPTTTAAVSSKPTSAESSRPPSRQGSEAPKPDIKKPAILKKESSSLFKSFAKTKPPAAKKEASASEDDSMRDAPSEGEDEAPAEDTAETKAAAEAARLKRQQSKADMDAMMEASDASDEDKADSVKDEEGDIAMTDAEAVAEDASALDVAAPPESQEQQTSTSGGRRRGRRRVMKKKTTKDKDNYLVTTEEPVWESFSEDEPEPKRKTVVAAPVGAKKSVGGGGGGGATNKGQGNIMNFFGKR